MKATLLLLLVLPILAISQTIVIGRAADHTKLYLTIVPRELTHKPPPSYIITHIQKGEIVASYARHYTDYGTWLLAYYNGTRGYVRLEDFLYDEGQLPMRLPRDTNKTISYDSVIVRLKRFELGKITKDSLRKTEREQENFAMAEANRKEYEKTVRDSIKNSIVAVNIVKQGFGILNFEFPADDYSVGFEISVVNYSKSTIKYIWVTIAAYNPVNDLIGTKTVKMVGPVPHGETGEVEFDNVFFTRVFHWGKLTKVRVQYMDGKFREFAGKVLNDIIMD